MIGKGLGYIPDAHDHRDLLWRAAVAPTRTVVPPTFRCKRLGPVLNQGDQPQCVAFSAASVKMHHEYLDHRRYYDFSPEWLYALCKKRDGNPKGAGTFIRIALQIVQEQGYLAKAAPRKLKVDTHFGIESYVRLTTMQQIKEALILLGPVIFGITVDEGLYTPDSKGVIPEPDPSKNIGGHAQLIVGYSDKIVCQGSTGAFLVKNSWGQGFGLQGYYWLPYTHFTTYSDFDAWKTVDSKELLNVATS